MLQFSSEPGYDEEITLIIGKALKCLALVRTGRRFIHKYIIQLNN